VRFIHDVEEPSMIYLKSELTKLITNIPRNVTTTRLARYYRTSRKLDANWKYESATASALVA
jgi:hypothetical protein